MRKIVFSGSSDDTIAVQDETINRQLYLTDTAYAYCQYGPFIIHHETGAVAVWAARYQEWSFAPVSLENDDTNGLLSDKWPSWKMWHEMQDGELCFCVEAPDDYMFVVNTDEIIECARSRFDHDKLQRIRHLSAMLLHDDDSAKIYHKFEALVEEAKDYARELKRGKS